MPKQYKAVIFDLDGTLYNNRHLPIQLVLSDPLKAFWMLSERVTRKRLAGREFESEADLRDLQFRMIAVKHRSVREEAKEWYENSYMPTMVRLIHEKHPRYAWAIPLIEYYRSKGLKIGLFSDYAWTHEKLQALGFDEQLFDVIADGPMLAGLKPCTRSFLRVAEMLGVEPADVLMIGDRDDTDGEGSKNAHFDFVNVKKIKDINSLYFE